jgi:hypothetical protein
MHNNASSEGTEIEGLRSYLKAVADGTIDHTSTDSQPTDKNRDTVKRDRKNQTDNPHIADAP